MANPTLTIQMGHVDPNASPLTVNELIDLQNTTLTGVINGSYIPYIIQQATPGVDDRDKAWIELDTAGRPLSVKIWYPGGATAAWRRVYNGMIGEVRGYQGNPGFSDDANADFDVNGHGKVGGRYDGWQICNGKNGSSDISDRFIIGAHMNNNGGNNGYDNGWQTVQTVNTVATVITNSTLATNGLSENLILPNNLPALDNRTSAQIAAGAREGLYVAGNASKDDSTVHTSIKVLVDDEYANARPFTTPDPIAVYGSSPSSIPPVPQVPFPTLPPFYILAWMAFQGY